MKKQMAIAGATGLVGTACLDFLTEAGECDSIVSLTRRASGRTHPKLTEVVCSLDAAPAPPLGRVDALFCCLGTTIGKAGSQEAFRKVDRDLVLAFANWGLKYQARHFLVVSSMGADPESAVFYNRTKGEMESEIRKLPYESVDIFRPSLLLGDRSEFRPGEAVGRALAPWLGPLMVGSWRNYRAISVATVGKAMVQTARDPKPGVRVHLSGEIQRMVS